MTPENVILTGDCVEVMAGFDAESVDAIVCDPPYNLVSIGKRFGAADAAPVKDEAFGGRYTRLARGFMGKAWDGDGVAFRPQTWEAAYRVARPSSYLLAFGGTRTVHRMTTAIEDAGWIIRDMLVWAYASGFPKSKASLKPAWEPIVMARKPGPLRMLAIDECRIPFESPFDAAAAAAAAAAGYSESLRLGHIAPSVSIGKESRDGTEYEGPDQRGRWPANVLLTDPIFDGGIEGVVGGGESVGVGVFPHTDNSSREILGSMSGERERMAERLEAGTYSRFFLIPRRYNEPCPDCGRVSSAEPPSSRSSGPVASAPGHAQTGAFDEPNTTTGSPITSATATPSSSGADSTTPSTPRSKPRGTSPVSEPASSPAKSPDAAGPATGTTTTTPDPSTCATCAVPTTSATTRRSRVPADEPDYTRFLLIPKADRTDREPVMRTTDPRESVVPGAGGSVPAALHQSAFDETRPTRDRLNLHPTVKPVDLMRHLVRLVTPADGIVLDPFLGSGTTALACELEGFRWLGIEREPEYVAIAEARLNGTQRGLGLVG